MMKLGTILPYIKKIQKIYESRDLSSADISIFYKKSETFVVSRNTDCILIYVQFF